MRRLLPRFALMLSLSMVAGGSWLAAPAVAEGEFNQVGSFRLPGHLEVITSESRAGKVTVDTWVKAGSASDFPGYPGIAHATAFALWEGGARPLSAALTALGATTRFEVTRDASHFSATLPKDKLVEGMDLIGAAFANPNWATLDLNGVKVRLAGDYARQQADVPLQAFETLMRELYGPDYGHKPFGQPDAVARLTVADLQAFFDRHYVPNQIKVVLVGDFDTGKSVGQVVRSYAALLKRTSPAGAAPARPLAPSTERKSVGTVAQVVAGARGPAMGEQRDQATMAMVASVLGDGEKSRLNRALGGQATGVSARWVPFKGPGALVVQVAGDPKNTMAIEKAIRDALAELRNTPVTLDEHARAMGAVVGAYMQDNDTLAEQAQTLGFFTTIGGDPLLARTYPEVVRQVSRNDMMEAAQKYLTPDAIKVIVLAP